MINGIPSKQLILAVIIFISLLFCAVLFDFILHLFEMQYIGRFLGILGSVVILLSFLYSLRKRKVIKTGLIKSHLISHELLGWIGALMICIHAGIHFNSLLPWLALISMLVVVASGLTGKYLLSVAKSQLSNKKLQLDPENNKSNTINNEFFFAMLLVDIMQKWRKIHLPLTAIFLVFTLLHIITILALW